MLALEQSIGTQRYRMWFDQATRIEIQGAEVSVQADSQFVADWITKHFRKELERIAVDELGSDASIRFSVLEGITRPDTSPGHLQPSPARHGRGPLPNGGQQPSAQQAKRPRFQLRRLDDFVVGQSNSLAFDASRRIASETHARSATLFIHGECGVGKTHLLQGICRSRRSLFPEEIVRYTTGEQFTNSYISALRNNRLEEFRRNMRKVDVLAIDDIHFLSNKTATQNEFLHTLDAIDLGGAVIVLASDEHPRLIRSFNQALVSRFMSGMVVRVDSPDSSTRIALIRRFASARGVHLEEGAAEAIAGTCMGSVRELEGALNKAIATAAMDASAANEPSRALTIGRLVIEKSMNDQAPRPVGIVKLDQIIGSVCEVTSTTMEELSGSSRHRRIVLARGLVVHLARQLTSQSYPEIARALGRPTHSTAHAAGRRIQQLVDEDGRVTGLPDQPAVSIRQLLKVIEQRVHGTSGRI